MKTANKNIILRGFIGHVRMLVHQVAVLMLVALALTSCEDPAPGISASVKDVAIDPFPTEVQTIDISANVSWNAVVKQTGNWLSIDPVSGSNDVVMSLYVQDNETPDERVALIILRGDEVMPDTITVTQLPSMDVAEKIPDDGFRQYCINNFDTNGDGKLSLQEVRAVKEINVYSYAEKNSEHLTIYSLEGIEYFTALETLNCMYNDISTLDISKNTTLVDFACSRNQLTSIDISKNVALTIFSCTGNKFTTLDVSNNKDLIILECGDNQLSSLDVSKNPRLITLECSNNLFKNLNVSTNPDLVNLWCSNNQLTNIDVSNNPALRQLLCTVNQLTVLDISINKKLEILDCRRNNNLTTIYVWPGFNTSMPTFYKDDKAKYVVK